MAAKFRIELAERRSPHLLERHPRYDVLLNGESTGELYYNVKGYVGTLPTISGARLDIGERPISAFRREAAILNREAKEAIARQETDSRRILLTRPTGDPSLVFAVSGDGETRTGHFVSRKSLIMAEKLFGPEALVALGFLREDSPGESAEVLLRPGDAAFAMEFPDFRMRIMDAIEAENHERHVVEAHLTSEPAVLLLISRRVADDADPEPHFVSNLGYRLAKASWGDKLRIGDIRPAGEAEIRDIDLRARLRADFPWLNLDGPDAHERRLAEHVREQAALEAWSAHDGPLDDAERHQLEQEKLTGPEDLQEPSP